YVVGALKQCGARQILIGCITCNPDAAVIQYSDFPVVAIVGPEFVTGSTRMKAGTAQKLILNMISTTAMIRLGHVRDNKMVDMQLTNHKLIDRGTRMIMDKSDLSYDDAKRLLITHGSVRKALEFLKKI
ncbi:MAG: N-acetylmuramic acid 6-phosphate etherase, partial [Flavobacteriales bacterium]|nr:N-acetylmuramic acid 6-phosphate etherase [Flavobacteriales bacterium]